MTTTADKDFVLVYEEHVTKRRQSVEEAKHSMWRAKFLTQLQKTGLQLEKDVRESNRKLITSIKLHVPWDACCYFAEDLGMRVPIQAHQNTRKNFTAQILQTLHVSNIMDQWVPNEPPDYYTCQFKASKLHRYLGASDQRNFFSRVQRHRIVNQILSTTVFGKRKKADIGIDRLVEERAFCAAFPLHDGPYKISTHSTDRSNLNPRQVLYEYWARWNCWYKYQPLHHIREYFGEKIAIYFAWIGFYTAWLLPASVVGLLVFLYGLVTIDNNIPARDVCESEKHYTMCPQSDDGDIWNLSDVCLYVKLAYLFDHPGTVFFAVFISFWAVTFLEYWKRKNASLAYHWDCTNFEDEEERPRPEYVAKAPTIKQNPITGINEPFFDPRDRLPRVLSGMAAIVIMMVLVVIFIVAVIMYRIVVSMAMFESKTLRSQASLIASLSAAVVNLIIIMALGRLYEKLALSLTHWEMHRTQREFENQLIFKVFVFQFVNFYSSIIYIAFFKGRFTGYPGHYNRFFGLRSEECNNGGCLIELAQQLAVIMIGKQIINNAQEVIVPKLRGFWHRFNVHMVKNERKTRWQDDYELITNDGLFQEYLEMVLQFGFITIFVAAFPIAPLFALLNNWVEIRLDAHKFVCETRRPVAERAQDIGVWLVILNALAQLAVISNAFLIAFTSEFLPRILYQYHYNWTLEGYTEFTLSYASVNVSGLTEECRYRDFRENNGNHTTFYWSLLAIRLGFVIVFEHVVFGVCRLIDVLVPDIPETLELKIKRERYLAKQALADTQPFSLAPAAEDDKEETAFVILDTDS